MAPADPDSRSTTWLMPPPLPDSVSSRFPRACRPLLQVLHTRQILDGDAESGDRLKSFLNIEDPCQDPMAMQDMARAADRILAEIDSGRPIGVFGHYDCDGVTATALVCRALEGLGGSALPFIPSRTDTYGIPINGIEALIDAGARLIVTVDCGIRARDEVEYARSRGIEIIITDHHHCERQGAEDADYLPAAYAVINPKRSDCGYSFKSLSGVGVAYRLAQALELAAPTRLRYEGAKTLLDFVCLGTVADVVELLGENRCLVASGLRAVRLAARPGVRSLIGASSLTPSEITAREVALVLAPRLNAASRMDHGKISLDLLMAPSCRVAEPLAVRLEDLNRQRRVLTEEAVASACDSLGSTADQRTVLVVTGHWLSGISGLVASRVRERFGRPALAICRPADSQDPYSVGSARSIPGFDITRALGAVGHRLVRYGGHTGAAGFTVHVDEIPALEEELETYSSAMLTLDELGPRLQLDAELCLRDLTPELRSQLDRFEPCGQGNPSPLFLVRSVYPLPGSIRGGGEERLSFRIAGPCGPIWVNAWPGCGAARPDEPVDLACFVIPDRRSAARLKLSVVATAPAQGHNLVFA